MAPHNQHFTAEEFSHRRAAAVAALAESDLDGILLFKIEDMYWLCGLDTDGFCIFHAMFLNRDGRLTHISRVVDLANIRYSSICEDIRIWRDDEDEPVTRVIKETLASHRMAGKRVGIQLDT
ncbi:aminopeptidase P family N-terminal domain-containing protein, partial [Sinomonas humi]